MQHPASDQKTTRRRSAASPVSAAPRRVFIVDDHPLVRLGLRELISAEPDLEVCGEAGSMTQALAGLRAVDADLVIVDIGLPGANGLELIKHIRAERPKQAVFVLSAQPESVYAMRALRAGARGYLSKLDGCDGLLPAIRKVLEGELSVSDALGERLILEAVGRPSGGTPVDVLSDRELEVLELIGEGLPSCHISELLHLSVKTVECHRLHLKEKLNLASAPALVRFALDWARRDGPDGAAQSSCCSTASD